MKARKGLFEVSVVVAIAFVGAVAVAKSIFTPPSVHYPTYMVNDITKQDLKRMPASVGKEGSDLRPTLSMATLEMGCEDTQKDQVKYSVRSRQVRLVTSLCGDQSEVEEITVTNVTNGHHATVFSGEFSFQTDYIHLTKGENKIEILKEHRDGNKESVQIVVINDIQ